MRIACLAGIHGNPSALAVAWEDLKRQRVDDVVSLGDLVGPHDGTAEVATFARKRRFTCLKGPMESSLAEPGADADAKQTADALARPDVAWLSAATPTRRFTGPAGTVFAMATAPAASSVAEVIVGYSGIGEAHVRTVDQKRFVDVGSVSRPVPGPEGTYVVIDITGDEPQVTIRHLLLE